MWLNLRHHMAGDEKPLTLTLARPKFIRQFGVAGTRRSHGPMSLLICLDDWQLELLGDWRNAYRVVVLKAFVC